MSVHLLKRGFTGSGVVIENPRFRGLLALSAGIGTQIACVYMQEDQDHGGV